MRPTILFALVATALSASAAHAAPTERLTYAWRLTGAIARIASVAIPTSGVGTLETRGDATVNSRLTMTTPHQSGRAFYESSMSADGTRTFTSADGYSWKDRSEEKHVVFDYVEGVARVEERSSEGIENKVRRLEDSTPQDVLTSIYYLRQNADSISTPRRSIVYSDGKGYAFIFSPRESSTMRVGGETIRVRLFEITPVDGKKKGTVRVWLTEDAQHVPVRIEIDQRYATLKLELRSQG